MASRVLAVCVALLCAAVLAAAAPDFTRITSPAGQFTTWVSDCYLLENTDTKFSFDDYDPGALFEAIVDPTAKTLNVSTSITQTSSCRTSAIVSIRVVMTILDTVEENGLTLWNVNVTSASVTVYGDITVDEFNTNYDPGKNCGLKSGEPVNIAENGCGTFFAKRSDCPNRWFASTSTGPLKFAAFYDQKNVTNGCSGKSSAISNFVGLPNLVTVSNALPNWNLTVISSNSNPAFLKKNQQVTFRLMTTAPIQTPSATVAGIRYVFPASADNKTWNLVLNSAEFQDKVSDGSIVNQFVKLQPLRTLEGRFIFSEVSDVTFGPEVFMDKGNAVNVNVRLLLNDQIVNGSQFAQGDDVIELRVTGFNLLGGKETVQIGFNATGNTASTWVNVSRDASSADALLRFKYIIKSTDLTGRIAVRVVDRTDAASNPGPDSLVGSASTFTITATLPRVVFFDVPALLNTKFEPNGFVFVVVRCKPAGLISWQIAPNTNQEDGWRADPASFQSSRDGEFQCGAADTQLQLSIPALSLSKKTRYYLYFKADTSPILNAPYAFAVPNEYSCFPGSSVITLADGSALPMRQLAIGDKVLSTADNGASEVADVVYTRVHVDDFEVLNVEYETEEGQVGTLRVTPEHAVFTTACADQTECLCAAVPSAGKLVLASELQVGTGLWVRSTQGVARARVASVLVDKETETFSAISSNGRMIVDGVVVSSYGSLGVDAAHWLHGWHRMWYNISPAIVKSALFQAFDEFAIGAWSGSLTVRQVVRALYHSS